MSNIKKVTGHGTLPFNAGDDQDLLAMIGRINLPVFGLGIVWECRPTYVPNAHGGQTAMYRFHLEGHEAVSEWYLSRFHALVLRAGGKLSLAGWDFENDNQLVFAKGWNDPADPL